MSLSVLIVDDEPSIRAALAQTLDLADIPAAAAGDVAEALRMAKKTPPGVVISDMRMPGEDGFALLAAMREIDAEIPVILLTGHGDVPMAVKAMNEGAYDFLEKPAAPARLVEAARRALDRRRLVLENRDLRRRVADRAEGGVGLIFGDSPASSAYRERLEAVAAAEADVLIVGETGAGKEGAARAIHALSSRRRGPFVALNCGALPADVAEQELFGHEIGAFPGARVSRAGRFEQAEGGVLFLDQVESMSPALQVRLLRVLEEREVRRLGADKPIRIDIRIVAATKADLAAEVAAGRFRDDLYYRLDVARLRVPPLRERLEDAPRLFSAFVEQASDGAARRVTPDIVARLTAHDWPGNVRELKNAAERFAQGLGLSIGDAEGAPPGATLADQVDAFEKQVIAAALRDADGRVAAAAEALGLPRKTLYDKLARHGLSGADFKT